MFRKDICIRCVNRNRKVDSDIPSPWNDRDDRSWRISHVIRCSVKINEMFPLSIHDELPEECFFRLEQLVSAGEIDDHD